MGGNFPALEEELYGFTTNGFMGEHSPNRADAMMWGISDLFPELLKHKEEAPQVILPQVVRPAKTAWMHR